MTTTELQETFKYAEPKEWFGDTMKIPKERKEEFIYFLRVEFLSGKTRREIIKDIKEEFNADYAVEHLRYLKSKAFYEENQEHVREDNRKMALLKIPDKVERQDNYADHLGDLAEGKITSSEFMDMEKNVC